MPERRVVQRRQRSAQVNAERREIERRCGVDRRRMARLQAEIWTEEISGQDSYYRRTGNISVGGACFDKAIPRPVGTPLSLRMTLPGDAAPIFVQGEVVSIAASGFGMGIKFLVFAGDGAKRLRQFLQTVPPAP